MLSIGATTRVYVAVGATDMRKSFDTLSAVVSNQLGHDPLSGDLFVFCNRARNRLKILVWETEGFWLCARRLERGTFKWPEATGECIELTSAQLALLLGGIDLRETTERRWHRHAPSKVERHKRTLEASNA